MKNFEDTMNIINEEKINQTLLTSINIDVKYINEILSKAKELHGLSLQETATLLNIEDEDVLSEIFKTAKIVKEKIYGNRIVLFAPLYLTSHCVNNCLYCAFRSDNKEIERVSLSPSEIRTQIEAIVEQGHKRVLLVCGEHPKYSHLEYIEIAVKTAYDVKIKNGKIRRVHINAAPMSVDDFRTLKSFNIGVFQSFQETYHRETYKKMHPQGPKANYDWRVLAMHRAFEAGLGDVGMGVLYGLYDYKFEVLATLMHCQSLDRSFGVGPHTLSIPRIEPAKGADLSEKPPYPVSNKDFKKMVAILRLAIPFTGIILTTRESAKMRNEVLHLGVSQISAGSKTTPGGYSTKAAELAEEHGQFFVADHRSLDEIVQVLCKDGFLPSFCTSCYREGRVGEDFMELSKPGKIKNFCFPNAVSTFKEYLIDYASENTKNVGEETIKRMLNEMPEDLRLISEKLLSQINQGKRDCYI